VRSRRLVIALLVAVLVPVLPSLASADAITLHFPGQITVPLNYHTNSVVGVDVDDDGIVEVVAGLTGGRIVVIEETQPGVYRPQAVLEVEGTVTKLAVLPPAGRSASLVALTTDPDRFLVLEAIGGEDPLTVVARIELTEDPGGLALGPLGPGGTGAVAVTLPGADSWLLLGRSGSDWQILQQVPAGDRPMAAAAVDLDGDGTLEVVTADAGVLSHGLSIYAQDMEGRYARTAGMPSAGQPAALFLYQVAADAGPDLFVSYADSTFLSVYRAGAGSLTEQGRIDTEVPSDGVLVAPVLPGELGLWSWNAARGIVQYFRQRPAGWLYRETYYCGGEAADLASADINGDQLPDLVVANGATETVGLLFSNNRPGFRAYLATLLPATPTGGLLLDENGDGNLDLAVPCLGSATIEFLHSDGAGHLLRSDQPIVLGNGPRALVGLHADADTLTDLAFIQPTLRRVRVLRRLAAGGYEDLASVATGSGPFSLVATDLDDDGNTDLLVANEANSLTLAYGAGDGSFPQVDELPLLDQLTAATAVDLNGDRLPELILTGGVSRLTTMANLGNRQFGQVRFYELGGSPRSLAHADLDGDEDEDLVVTQEAGPSLAFLENLGGGALAIRINGSSLPSRPGALVTGDVDLDGWPDVVVAMPDTHQVAIVRSIGSWIVFPPINLASAVAPASVGIGDFNGDQIPDLVTVDLALELALTMLNIEPNPVPVDEPSLTAVCAEGELQVAFMAPEGSWRLEGEGIAGWVTLCTPAGCPYGWRERDGQGYLFHLDPTELAAAGLAEEADGQIAFRLRVGDEPSAPIARASRRCLEGPPDRGEVFLGPPQARPNPFNPHLAVAFTLGRAAAVRGRVCDLAGRRVADLGRRWYPAGRHELIWDGMGRDGPAGAGSYLLVLEADGRTITRKVTLLK
jgi:hypothetical protein